mgnify:CR=1 FL=1
MKKRIWFIIIAVSLMIVLPYTVFAEENSAKHISIRIEGIHDTIAQTPDNYTFSGETALEAVREFLNAQKIPYHIQDDAYIISIGGETAGTFDGWDGWLFAVNGVMAETGMGSYKVQDNDRIVVFYGGYTPQTLLPVIEIKPERILQGEEFQVKIKSTYFDYGKQQNVTVNIQGAEVLFNEKTYTTDANGEVKITAPETAGLYELKVSQDRSDNYPLIVRNKMNINVTEPDIISEPEFYKDGIKLDTIESGLISCEVEITNHYIQNEQARLIVVLYKDKKLVSVAISPLSEADIKPGETKRLGVKINVPENEGYVLKALVIDGFNHFIPLRSAVTLMNCD